MTPEMNRHLEGPKMNLSWEVLKPRDVRVLRRAAQGLTNQQIANETHYALKTVEHMMGTSSPHASIFDKIGVTNRTEAASWFSTMIFRPFAFKKQDLSIENLSQRQRHTSLVNTYSQLDDLGQTVVDEVIQFLLYLQERSKEI